jgi:protein-S-isoprenylcysteine O-methyltransferase Ste14
MSLAGHDRFLLLWALLGLGAAIVLFFTPAPYGRHERRGWGPTVEAKWGWVLMEAAAVVVLPAMLLASGRRDAVSWTFVALWEIHYLHRAFVFPFRHASPRRTPWAVVGMALAFNLVNGYLNGAYLFELAPQYPARWLTSPQFLVGLAIFASGMALNLDSDNRLLRLRRESQGYAVPHGGAFRWVSCPNYLGEILEWTGFALATASPAAWAFAWWTVANLAPRAWAHHRWYRDRFEDYPARRRALVPFLW